MKRSEINADSNYHHTFTSHQKNGHTRTMNMMKSVNANLDGM